MNIPEFFDIANKTEELEFKKQFTVAPEFKNLDEVKEYNKNNKIEEIKKGEEHEKDI